MLIKVARIGKPAFAEYRSLCKNYEQRLSRHFRIELVEIKAKAALLNSSEAFMGALFSSKKSFSSKLIALDETGKAISSVGLAQLLKKYRDDSRIDQICFSIGPPFGYPEGFLANADEVLSLSAATLTTDMCELLLWEQLYRAQSIIDGGSYHHE